MTDAAKKVSALRAGGLEEATLRAVMHQRGKGYAVTLKPDIESVLGKNLTYGGIYTTLDRLEQKGFVESTWGEPDPVKGGRRKQYFKVTGIGEIALAQVENQQQRMRTLLPNLGGAVPDGGA